MLQLFLKGMAEINKTFGDAAPVVRASISSEETLIIPSPNSTSHQAVKANISSIPKVPISIPENGPNLDECLNADYALESDTQHQTAEYETVPHSLYDVPNSLECKPLSGKSFLITQNQTRTGTDSSSAVLTRLATPEAQSELVPPMRNSFDEQAIPGDCKTAKSQARQTYSKIFFGNSGTFTFYFHTYYMHLTSPSKKPIKSIHMNWR